MNKQSTPLKMVATKNKVLSCSTPEHRAESPSRDSDSICDSESASPVPFLCTQDGAEGETDVVWNFYTPKSDHAPTSRLKNSTPLTRKAKKSIKPKVTEKPKRRVVKPIQKTSEIFQDLLELNKNIHEIIAKKSKTAIKTDKFRSGSDEDIFSDSGDCSPKSGLKTNSRCLRRNLLSSKFGKPDTETALESDDSMNECLIKASQVVEENILKQEATPAKRPCYEQSIVKKSLNLCPSLKINIDEGSMDAILNSIKLDSPIINKTKKCESPQLNNDSFDSFVENLNDSALERLTQLPVKNTSTNRLTNSEDGSDWTVQELVVHDGSPMSKSFLTRYNSMPESPSVARINKPSTSGMSFGRYNSMPHDKNINKNIGDSPIRCTPDEIKRKHQQAREKLLAKRLLPFTSTHQQQNSLSLPSQTIPRKTQFQPKLPSSATSKPVSNTSVESKNEVQKASNSNSVDLKLIIEKKRQEALLKLRRRQPQNKRL